MLCCVQWTRRLTSRSSWRRQYLTVVLCTVDPAFDQPEQLEAEVSDCCVVLCTVDPAFDQPEQLEAAVSDCCIVYSGPGV